MNGRQLKNSILQLAIQGKLVDQDPNDEPASALLARIRKEKEQLVKDGKLKKKDLATTPISDEEKPFEIPKTWEWVRHNEIFNISGGSQPPKSKFSPVEKDGYIRLYQIRDYGPNPDPIYIDKKYATKITQKEDILLARYGGSLGKVFFAEYGAYNVAMAKIIPYFSEELVSKKYLYYYYNTSLYRDIVMGHSRSAQGGFNKEDLNKLLFPLPPLAEQHRIVEKIEELMPLVEEYDKAQTKLDKLNEKLPEALKKSILQLAIQGKLVDQDPNDEPASALLTRIRKEKEQLVKDGKLKKKDLATTPISDEEKPFEIPETWEWCRLGEICSFLSRGKSPKYSIVPNLYPVFAQKCNLKDGGISLEQARFLDPNTIDKWQEIYKLRTDDILVNSTGTGTVCRTRLFHENYLGNYPFTIPDSHVTVVRTFAEISSAFYFYIFNSKHIKDYWEDRLAGSTNQKELYIGTLHETLIPLPPLAEQHRIVEKIEELMPLVENLK